MTNEIEIMQNNHGAEVMKIFNHYISNCYSAYFEEPLPAAFFKKIMDAAKSYPSIVIKTDGIVSGFAFLHAYHPAPSMRHTAEIVSFIHPSYTGRGLGEIVLENIVSKAKEAHISNILANISSKNTTSIDFHKKHGFVECGRFKNVGVKFGNDFDIIYMQRIL